MAVRVDSLDVIMCDLVYDAVGQITYHIMVGYVQNELAESIRTSTTVFHGPVQMDFNAPS